MASIPVPQLQIQQPINPLEQMGRIVALRSALQEQQSQQQQIQQGQLALQDQQIIRQAFMDNNGDLDGTLRDAAKNGASPNTLMTLQQHAIDQKLKVAQADETTIKNQTALHDQARGKIQAVLALPPEQRYQAAQDALNQGVQSGQFAGMPQSAIPVLSQDPATLTQQLQMFDTALAGGSKAMQEQTALRTASARELQARTGAERFTAEIDPNSPIYNPSRAYLAKRAAAGDPDAISLITAMNQQVAAKAGAEAQGKLPYEIQKEQALVPIRIGEQVGAEVGKARALAPTLDQVTNTTMSGNKYADVSQLTGPAAAIVKQQAYAAGIPVVDKDTAATLRDIDTAKANQQYMMSVIGSKLAPGPGSRLYTAPGNTLESLAQTDPDLAAVGTFRNAAIQSMRAVAGSKGLRINQAEIQMAIDNDIPKLTDTLPVAQQKLKNLQTFLQNAENAHLQQNRQPGATQLSPAAQGLINKYTQPLQ